MFRRFGIGQKVERSAKTEIRNETITNIFYKLMIEENKAKNWTLKKLFNCKISCIGILSVQFYHKNNIIRYLHKRFLGFTAEKRNSNMGLFCLLTRYCIFVEHCTKYHLKYK